MSTHTVEPDVADEVVDRATPVTTALVTVDPLLKIQAGLEALAAAAPKLDLTTKAGEKALREYRAQCVNLRSQVDAAYETVNRPMLNAQRRAREVVADIKAAIGKVEGPVDAAIKAEEGRRESERAARIAAEQARIDAIRRRMLDLFTAPVAKVAAGTASEIADAMAWVERTAADSSFEDLQLEAETLKSACLDRLRAMHSAAVLHERQQAERLAEQARVEAEAAERRKAEAAEREAQRQADSAAREERARVEREERAAHEAENARLREENAKLAAEKAQRERAEAEARAQQEAIDRAHRELQDRLAREAAEHQERLARERREREEEVREAERAALDQMQRAAPVMLEALRRVRVFVDDAMQHGAVLGWTEPGPYLVVIDDAIAAATGETAATA